MRIKDLLEYEISVRQNLDNILYHSYNNPLHAIIALKNNRIDGRTSQRYFPDGNRLKDTHPKYNESFWMKGISLTRDFGFAKKWGDVIFVLDRNLIKQNYKILPFNWGFSISGTNSKNHKKESEEFIVTSVLNKTFKDIGTEELLKSHGALEPLNKFLKGIYITHDYKDLNIDFNSIINHPKFKGYYKR